ncbi:hypothetical protein [Hyphomicrobium sulfonivorans]|uniref:hypothetical protein n=1 Tax=Hyphomicrobium sulfonivorans TaxID=121290 RepID=UPI001570DB8C|nr:hypothetical protein [Hyphomicrobium sulfonivorans]MBI1649892.1 hypothetical protein [Hyphomicrobium sulfonivorans]NSL71803.1 hypothetical protein [Hyphomicrobium sulfonivorans]
MQAVLIALARRKIGAALSSGPLLIAVALIGAYGLGWYVGKHGAAVRAAIATQIQKAKTVEADLSRANDALSRERQDAAALERQKAELEERLRAHERELEDGACRLGNDGRRRLLDIGK